MLLVQSAGRPILLYVYWKARTRAKNGLAPDWITSGCWVLLGAGCPRRDCGAKIKRGLFQALSAKVFKPTKRILEGE